MENSRERLTRYCRQLAMYRQPGKNRRHRDERQSLYPGHRWLVEQAAPVRLAASVCGERRCIVFRYRDRVALIEQGIAGIENVTLHPGSAYLISRATFPGYFLKDKAWLTIATARSICSSSANVWPRRWAITHRFVGSEPLCELTRYNQRMRHCWKRPATRRPFRWLSWRESKRGRARFRFRVRTLSQRNWQAIAPLVPPGTSLF
jgi:[citrate (pro-3S)-lyase] ligase